MNIYDNTHEDDQDAQGSEEGLNTMAVLSTLGGGEEPLPEGEALGLDPDAGQAKLSGSSLAVGVVVVLGAVALLGMKLTLGSIAGGDDPTEDISQIDAFLLTHTSGGGTTISEPDAQSQQVLEELNADPTDHQVPAEEVESNPFDISVLIATGTETDTTPTTPRGGPTPEELRQEAYESAQRAVAQMTVNAIAGNVVFIDGQQCRIGQALGNTGFMIEGVEGLVVILRTTDEYAFRLELNYR